MTQNARASLLAHHRFLVFIVESVRITEEDLERYMMTNLAGSPPLDVLIRSSGVRRLSDFLTWQVWFNFLSGVGVSCLTNKSFAGFRKRPASFYFNILAGYWILGLVSYHSGLSGEGVESTR